MTNKELAEWIEDNIHEPSGYPDGSVIWRLRLSNEKVAQITAALRRGANCNYPNCDGGPATGYCHADCLPSEYEKLERQGYFDDAGSHD